MTHNSVILYHKTQAYLLTCTGVNSCAIKKHCCSSITEWSIHHIAVSSNPADIGSAGKNVTRFIIKVILSICIGKWKNYKIPVLIAIIPCG